jgi:predicted O-linked N-acetylglucosamine transferase (SPINDLY family)
MAALTVAEALARAEQLFRAGQLDEMERLCRAILDAAPGAGDAHRFLGLSAYARGRLDEALACVRRAVALNPDEAAGHDNLSLILAALGRHPEAEAAARRALALQPSLFAAAHNLGRALLAQRRLAEAETALRRAVTLDPNDANAWNDLAAALEPLGQFGEAAAALERALERRPDFSLARENLQRLRAASAQRSAGVEENNRGVQLLAQRRYADAEVAFRRALLLQPDLPPAVTFNLAQALRNQQQLAEAEALYLRVLSQRPDWAQCHLCLGKLYFEWRRLGDAEAAYRRALSIQPDSVEALDDLGANVLNYQGRIDEARAAYQQALSLQPDHAGCHSNLLLNEHYAPDVTRAGLAAAHSLFEQRHAAPLRSTWLPFSNSMDPERPLRLGFVSADLFYHPVGIFLAPVLERLDRSQWLTVCYANQHKADDLTQRLRGSAGCWRTVIGLTDEALAGQIRGDAIDLLIDLSGHTGRNRLLAFARRPAPVQLTWLGYVGTTGLSAIDYLIADRYHVPPGWEGDYRETVLRLPDGYLCYEPPAYAPAVAPLPALTAGHVTFGCFNNTAKITPPVVGLWAEVLRRLPGSRLVVKYHWLDDAGLRRRLSEQFAARGITADRIDLLGSTTHVEQLSQYNRIDLALDPFPYVGGLTTCEACWMGVPVLTCPGETFASRHSLSHLSNVGLTETIAADHADYVARAVRLASDLPHLAELRAGLRQRMARSPLCDVDRFTAQLAAALRQVWRAWCAAGSSE